MSLNKLFSRFLNAKTASERAEVASNRSPGTHFDSFFARAERAEFFRKHGHKGNERRELEAMGAIIADTIRRQDVQALYEMTAALAAVKQHKAKPDFTLLTLAQMSDEFPGVSNRDVLALLETVDPEFDPDRVDTYRQRIRRWCRRLRLELDKSPGRPAK